MAINSNDVTDEDRNLSVRWFANLPEQSVKSADSGAFKKIVSGAPAGDSAGGALNGGLVATDGLLELNSLARANSIAPQIADAKALDGLFDFKFGCNQTNNSSRANAEIISSVMINRKMQDSTFDEVLPYIYYFHPDNILR